MVGEHCVDIPRYCEEIAPDIPADMRGYSVETAWPPVDIRRTPGADITRSAALSFDKGMVSNQNDRLSVSRKPRRITFG
jgi:hypothetical protein